MNYRVKFVFVSIATLILSIAGCASGTVSIDDLDISISDLQKAVHESLPAKSRGQSASGREFKTVYFVQKKGEFEEVEGGLYRSYASIEIHGDRRPYSIVVQVPVEKRTSEGHYELFKYDEGTARVITRRIQKALHERREDRNIIDDFRAF